MLSTKQKQLRDLLASSEDSLLANGYRIRALDSSYDLDRVTELWANLSMVQQMHGHDRWLKAAAQTQKSWKDYVASLSKSRGARILVFENQNLIFGFAYLQLQPMNLNNPKQKPSLKAIIRELYLEPAYREQSSKIEMAQMLDQCLQSMNISYFEFDIVDL